MNVDLKILSAFDTLDKKIKSLADRFDGLSKQSGPKGDKGERGERGLRGDAGRDGINGVDGKDGIDGKDGRDGKDGQDGNGVADARVDLDGHLVLVLDDDKEIDAGSLDLEGKVTNYYQMGSNSSGTGSLYIQDTQPVATGKYLWVDTSGTDITLWVEDGIS